MARQATLGRTLAIAALAGATLFALHILQNPRPPSTTKASTAEVDQATTSYGLPVRLKIPKLNIDAPVEHVGLTPEGDMQAPNGLQNVGWYKFGPHPGNIGSAVIAGHFGRSQNGELSVFEELRTLGPGDLIYIEDENGRAATFAVRELRVFSQNQAAPSVFGSNDGGAHLNLITCQGIWDETQQTYQDRLVVFSDIE